MMNIMEKKRKDYVRPDVCVRMTAGVEMLCVSAEAHYGTMRGEDDVFGGAFGPSLWDGTNDAR